MTDELTLEERVAINDNIKTILEVYRPWTDRELEYMRKRSNEVDPEGLGFTCDDCGAKRNCALVFDPYNTNGDCLAEK